MLNEFRIHGVLLIYAEWIQNTRCVVISCEFLFRAEYAPGNLSIVNYAAMNT